MTMKQVIPVLIIIFFGQLAFAQGGKHHKDTAYDYHDYTNSNILTKKFNRYVGDPNNPIEEVWTFDRSIPGQVIRTEIRSDGGCMINIFRPTTSAFNWIQNNTCELSTDPDIPPQTTIKREYDPPVPVSTSAMIPGIAWGSGVVMIQTSIPDPDADDTRLPDGYYVDKNELLGIEDINVNNVTYVGCLKIHRLRYPGGSYSRIDWVCPEMGMVKRIQGGSRMMELISVEYN